MDVFEGGWFGSWWWQYPVMVMSVGWLTGEVGVGDEALASWSEVRRGFGSWGDMKEGGNDAELR